MKQRITLSQRTSSWTEVIAVVPQGSVLSSFLILIYINDLPDGLSLNDKFFGDDTTVLTIVITSITWLGI